MWALSLLEPPPRSFVGPPSGAPWWSGRDWTPFLNMDDTNTGNIAEEKKPRSFHESLSKPSGSGDNAEARTSTSAKCPVRATREYCEELQAWMWHHCTGYVIWHSWWAATALPCPYYLPPGNGGSSTTPQDWYGQVGQTLLPHPAAATSQSSRPGEAAGGAGLLTQQQQVTQENGNAPRAGE